MARLSSEVQRAIVQGLAEFLTPSEVRDRIGERYDVDVTLPQVVYYDGENPKCEMAEGLKKLFRETRERAERDEQSVPISHRGYRLRVLQQIVAKSLARGNHPLVMTALEQAAKERGDAYTNRRVITPEDPADVLARDLGIPAEELKKMVAGATPTTSSGDGT